MNHKSLLKVAAVVFLAYSGISCKDKLSGVDLMMTGSPRIDIDDYVGVGTEHEMTAGGITKPEDGVGYFWTVEPGHESNDTTDIFKFTFPDSVGTYLITSSAFAEGYYDSPSTKTVVAVDDEFNSTLNVGEIQGVRIITDSRDGMDYRYVKIGGTDWFMSNLAYRECGIPYENFDVMWNVFGGYYTFDEIESGNVCPEGWRVPSDSDWKALEAALSQKSSAAIEGSETLKGLASHLMARAEFLGERMWPYDPDCDPDNASGFSAAPLGYYSQNGFVGKNEYAVYWTADTYNDRPVYRYIYYEEPDLKVSTADRYSFRANVRCVR